MASIIESNKQARGLASAEKILAAAEELFSLQGVNETTVVHIVERSGVSIGSFYHHFESKEAVFHELIAQFCVKARADIENLVFDKLSVDACLLVVAEVIVSFFRRSPMLYKAMARRVGKDITIWEPMIGIRDLGEAVMLREFGHLISAVNTNIAKSRIETIVQVMLSVLTHSVLYNSGPISYKSDDCATRLAKLSLAILESET